MQEVGAILDFLRNTPFDGSRSWLDVTTVMINTEFSRTMRSYDFEKAGTDHNALTNTVLIGGKGIRGGLIIGASDRESVELNGRISPAHRALDPGNVKIMGKPFDFAKQRSIDAQPETFKPELYLSCGSVVNTVLSLFDVARSEWRSPARNSDPLPILRSLLI